MRTLKTYKPLYLVHESGIPADQIIVVTEAIQEMLCLGNSTQLIPFRNLGALRHSDWSSLGGGGDLELKQFSSVDYYIACGMATSDRRPQLNVEAIMEQLWIEPWQETQQHYDVLLTKHDLYADGTNFVVGVGIEGFGLTMSTFRFQKLDSWLLPECIKTIAMHELGHVFGLISESRTQNVEQSLGKHCTNQCIMRQGLRVPEDFIRITQDRLAGVPFCGQCLNALRNYFRG